MRSYMFSKKPYFLVILLTILILPIWSIPLRVQGSQSINSTQSQPIFQRLSSGRIFYDTFSKDEGTNPDDQWSQGIYTYGRFWPGGTMYVENGLLRTEHIPDMGANPSAYPTNVEVVDFVWEVKAKSMVLSGEGPELYMFVPAPDKCLFNACFDSYASSSLRLMIQPVEQSSHSIYKTVPYLMTTNQWYTMKMEVYGSNIKCYINGDLVIEANDNNLLNHSPAKLAISGYDYDEWGYWDDVKIWKSNIIKIKNIGVNQKVELYDSSNNLKSQAVMSSSNEFLDLSVSALFFPFKGYFKIYGNNGQILMTTQVYEDIWGGDEYLAQSIRIPKVLIDVFSVSGNRCDIGTTQSVRLHAKWDNGTDVSGGIIYVNGNEYSTNSGGLITVNVNSSNVGKLTWKVTAVDCYGVTDFTQTAASPSIIWDKVNATISLVDDRIDIGSPAAIQWKAYYQYDGIPFTGKFILTASSYGVPIEAGDVSYSTGSILDNQYGLTVFDTNVVKCVWDRVKIIKGGVSNPISKTGNMETVWFKAVYEYDNSSFTGESTADGGMNKIFVNGIPLVWSSYDKAWKYSAKLEENGKLTFEVTGVEDMQYKLTNFVDAAGPQSITWEKPFLETTVGMVSVAAVLAIVVAGAIFFLRKRV